MSHSRNETLGWQEQRGCRNDLRQAGLSVLGTVLHCIFLQYTPGAWTATKCHEVVASTPFFVGITVVTLDVTGRSLPPKGQLNKSWAKIALYGKNCALCQQGPNLRKNCAPHDRNFPWGGDYVVTNVCGHLFAGGSCCMSIAPAVVADKDQREAVTHRKCQESDWSPQHGNSTERTNSGKRGAVLQIIQLGCWRIDRRLTHCLSLHLQLANSEVWSWYARREY